MACQGDTGVYFICISSSSSIPVVYGAAHWASDSASKHFDAETCSVHANVPCEPAYMSNLILARDVRLQRSCHGIS
jgi:hypothetical protein